MAFKVAEFGPVSAPGKCASCGSADFSKLWINTHIHIDFYGTVYLCGDCLKEVANFIEPPVAPEVNEDQNVAGLAALHFLSNLRDSLDTLDLYAAPNDSSAGEGTNDSEESSDEQGLRDVLFTADLDLTKS